MDTITLHNYLLKIGDNFSFDAFLSDFTKHLKNHKTHSFQSNGIDYVCILDHIKETSNFVYVGLDYGSNQYYSDEVVEIRKNSLAKNPKSRSQVEFPKQVFIIFLRKTSELYISHNGKGIFENLIKDLGINNATLENIIKSKDEFVKEISLLKNVRLTSKRNLLADAADIRTQVDYFSGFGADIEQFIIELKLHSSNKNVISEFIDRITQLSRSDQIDSLVCVGEDLEKIKKVFNINSFAQKIVIEVTKNDSNKANNDEVLRNIRSRLGI